MKKNYVIKDKKIIGIDPSGMNPDIVKMDGTGDILHESGAPLYTDKLKKIKQSDIEKDQKYIDWLKKNRKENIDVEIRKIYPIGKELKILRENSDAIHNGLAPTPDFVKYNNTIKDIISNGQV